MDLVNMTAEEAGQLVAETYAANSKAAFSLADLQQAVQSGWSKASPVLAEAWKNPYVRNALLASGGGAALGGLRNLTLSPEERRRRSLSGDVMTGATLGGLSGLGYTAATSLDPQVLAPADAYTESLDATNKQLSQAAKGELSFPERLALVGKLLGITGDSPTSSLADTLTNMPVMRALFPNVPMATLGGLTGLAGGHRANQLLQKGLDLHALQRLGLATNEALQKVLGAKKDLASVLTGTSPTSLWHKVKNLANPQVALAAPELKTKAQLATDLGMSAQDAAARYNTLTRQLNDDAAAKATFGVPNKNRPAAANAAAGLSADELKGLTAAREIAEKNHQRFLTGTLEPSEAQSVGRHLRNTDVGTTRRVLRHTALPVATSALAAAAGAQAPGPTSYKTIGESLYNKIAPVFNGPTAAPPPVAPPGLKHWNPDLNAEAADAAKFRSSVF